jgi:hypothetical protein
MADLRALFAKKDSNVPAQPSGTDGPPKSEPVSRAAEAPQATTRKPANPFAGASGRRQNDSGGQPAGGDAASGNDAGGSSEPKSGLSALPISAAARDSGVDTGSVDGISLDSLESLDATEDAGLTPRGSVAYFADETPATAPTRELPEGLTKEELGFVDQLNSVYEIIHDPDLLGGVIRNIMVELKSNAEYAKLMSPDDYRVMVRGMRESMGLAKVKKMETKAKRSGAKKGKSVDIDMLADLEGLGLNG